MNFASVLFDGLLVSFAAALLSLDRTGAFQIMASRPIIAAPIAGWLLGSVETGLMAGAVVELLFIGELPVGKYVPVHETGAAMATTAIAVAALHAGAGGKAILSSGALLHASVIAPALFVALPVSRVYYYADTFSRKLNVLIYHMADRSLRTGNVAGLMKYNLYGLAVFFFISLAAFLTTIPPIMYASSLFFSMKWTGYLLSWPAYVGLMVLGVASGIKALQAGKGEFVFLGSSIAVAIIFLIIG